MLKAIRALRLVRPLVNASANSLPLAPNRTQPIQKNEIHTSSKLLGGDEAEFLVTKYIYIY